MEINHERYKRIHEGVKYYFYIDSDKLKEDFKFINDNSITNIKLTPDLFKIGNIEPLLQLKHIQSLEIFLKGIDLGRLNEMHELEELAIGELNENIDVSNLTNLRDVYLLYHKNIKGLNTLNALKRLIVVQAEIPFFSDSAFSSWEKLEELALLSPKLPKNLSFLRNLKNLKELEIFSSRSTFDVSDLSFIKETLEILKIGGCKKIGGIEHILPDLKNLKWFQLTDSIPLSSINFVREMPKLETLIVLGSSYFIDGDIKYLKGRLKYVGIDNKKHYNMKFEDFKNS
jgi:hypothetical protein